MKPVTLVVPSKYPDIFEAFRANIEAVEPAVPKILIRTGEEIHRPLGWITFQGRDPFIYARNVNLGWVVSWPNDVLLTGDDVHFEKPFIEKLQEVAYSDPTIGFAVPELGGQSCFVCAYIKRELIEAVGYLDENFTGYGTEDNDFYRRFEAAGWRTQPVRDLGVTHQGGTSFYRREHEGGPNVAEESKKNWAVYNQKWGVKE